MAHRIALVTDSTSDIPVSWKELYGIVAVPMTVVIDDQVLRDGVDISPEAFYERLDAQKPRVTTSQPAPEAFLNAFRQAAAQGAEEILTITISSGMSGTMASAQEAAQEASIPVHVMDSKSNSMGLGWQVIAAARAREAGGGIKQMLAAAEWVRKKIVYYISLDTIEYLAKGGRISDAAKFLNSLLQIKPLIYVKPETGTVGASLPARSRKSALEGLYKEFFRHIQVGAQMHLTVLHNHALAEAQALAEQIQQEYAPKELFISIVSPALGVHTGPRAVAICGYAED